MSVEAAETRPARHWPSALQFGLSLLALFGLLSLAALAFGGGLFGLAFQSLSRSDVASTFMSGFAFLASAAILAVSAAYAYQGMYRRQMNWPWLDRLLALLRRRRGWLLLLSLSLGGLISQSEGLSLLALPPLHALTVILIFVFVFLIAARGLLKVSRQRALGVLTSGMLLAPLTVLPLEVIALLIVIIVLAIYLGAQPAYAELLAQLSNLEALITSQEELLELLGPLAGDPFVFGLSLFYIALLVPIIEELFKPLGLYLSLNRDWSPAQGFALGALSGAGFALFENLALAVPSAEWLPVVGARIGTTAMHILSSALFGWALVRAKREKRYWLAPWGFFISVLLHGLWNGLTIAASFSALATEGSSALSFDAGLVAGLLVGLLVLGLGSLFLLSFNRKRLLAAEQSG